MPTFGIRHRAARAEYLAQLTDDAHSVGACDHDVEIEVAALDTLGEVLHADDVGSGLLRGLGVGALREHRDPNLLAAAVRQHGGAADDLVGLLRIDAEIDRNVD